MKNIKANTIRFPAKLYEQLRKAAKTHRRSINEQIVTYLEQAMEQDGAKKEGGS